MSALQEAWSAEELESRIHRLLDERYHHAHPFHLRMYAGELTRDELRTWVRNRYYYQTRIPIKDGMIVDKSRDPGFRRQWTRRIQDHRGSRPGEGGLWLWLELAEAVGLEHADVEAARDVLPGVRRACDDYVRFVESHDLLESVAASLTELSAADFMARRVEAFEKHYPWIPARGLGYFRSRTVQARRDAEEGLRFVLQAARTRPDQERCLEALATKCDILWRLLDAVEAAHARPHLARGARLREEEGTTLVLLPERAVRLSASGREILDLCDGGRSALQIADELRARHPEDASVADDAHEFLAEMRRLGVIEAAETP